MANKVTLAALRKNADKQYASYVVEIDDGASVTLLPALKLSREKRQRLMHMAEIVEKEDADAVDGFQEWARIVATDEEEAELLIVALGDDLSLWKILQEEWSDRTQVGEA